MKRGFFTHNLDWNFSEFKLNIKFLTKWRTQLTMILKKKKQKNSKMSVASKPEKSTLFFYI